MPASAVFILDHRGKILISRNYRGDITKNDAEKFFGYIMEEEEHNLKPIFEKEGVNYIYVKHKDVYLLAITRHNTNAAMVLLFLHKLINLFEDYFKEICEESIKDNFVIVYELLDEIMDFGYPQATDSKILSEYITQEGHKLMKEAIVVPPALTNAVSWRKTGIKYRRNEVFLDVVERVNLLVASDGAVLRSEINGAVEMRCFLTGMPELRLGLNDRIQFQASGKKADRAIDLEDIKFHQCVRLSKFDSDRTISFIPPDGEFDVMTYRLSTQVKPLIWVEAQVEPHSRSRIEFLIKARSQFKERSQGQNVVIEVPVPADASTPKFKTTFGTVKYAPEKNAIIWTIKSFPGGKEYLMRAHFGLPSIESDDGKIEKPPISVKFEIPYFTVSGIQVRYLKIIEKSGYQAVPWVRYLTQSGDYQLRMPS
eukprot:TRINITY_DN10971_c0_g1_i1.p1 TRINITY_DN10971_c0_g1~~TRINITY_DN10971_c0_g1_i1.p1  ORF type:complete len:425 (+),score=97.60 TRINITY_DN10971_c0_g1_i1:140-1414(+)